MGSIDGDGYCRTLFYENVVSSKFLQHSVFCLTGLLVAQPDHELGECIRIISPKKAQSTSNLAQKLSPLLARGIR
jgi:hypothetical protein